MQRAEHGINMRAHEFIKLYEYRRDITAKNLGQRILDRGKGGNLDEILSQIESADPTTNKQYTEWIARRYIAGDFLLEDLSIVKQYLEKFIESRKLIPNKDINKYTLATLKELIRGIYSTGKPEQTEIAGLYPVLPETKVLYNGPEGQLVIPLTIKASQALQKLGHATEWCTADSRAPKNFPRYSEKGPLYIWIDKTGEKFQFHPHSGEYTDRFDNQLSKAKIQRILIRNPILSRYIQLITDLSLWPPEQLTYERCLAVVQNNGYALKHVPLKLRTPEMCLAAVQDDGGSLQSVPLKLRTPELCLIAVQTNAWALYDVPKKLRTPEICLAAVQNGGYVLSGVPLKLRTPEMCLAAVQNHGLALYDVPNELQPLIKQKLNIE